MSNVENSYSIPESNSTESIAVNGEKSRLYSPRQGGLAAFLGGPIAGAYVLKKNFEAVGNAKYAVNTTIIGILLILALIVIIPFLPEKFPSSSLGVVWVVITVRMMAMYLPTKDQIAESDEYQFRSNWSVLGVSITSIVVTIILIVTWAMVANSLGLITL